MDALTLATISVKDLAVYVSGCSAMKHLPDSQDNKSFGSRGTLPSSSTFMSVHILAAPPVTGGKIWL